MACCDVGIAQGYEDDVQEWINTWLVMPGVLHESIKHGRPVPLSDGQEFIGKSEIIGMVALHRMQTATVSTLGFERPKDFDLQAFDDQGRFGFGDGESIKLVFRINKSAGHHLLESRLSLDQVVTELSDGTGYEIAATVIETEQLKWWLRGFGKRVTVLAPENLLAEDEVARPQA